MEFRRVDIRTIKGIEEAERLQREGWMFSSFGTDVVTMYKGKSGKYQGGCKLLITFANKCKTNTIKTYLCYAVVRKQPLKNLNYEKYQKKLFKILREN